ncbi:MAG: metallophosphoesterase [Elusimicrobia bacterium]|nr:metallophosphoesterase [Candidatus Obscuribacterium magneticum]
MKIIYVTDLHGDEAKYWHVLKTAEKNNVQAVVNGGDMLSMEGDLHITQREFIFGFLNDYFTEFEKAGIYHIGYLGNDDLMIHDRSFDDVCSKYPHAVNLAQRKFKLGAYEVVGMNWVVDYPFQIKDRCRMDGKNYVFQRQLGPGLLSTEQGFQTLKDWFAAAMSLPTIEDELEALPKPENLKKAIYVIHTPPAHVGLDVCWSGEGVGSESIYKFIDKTQPLLTLHGHIHESYARSGVWKTNIGETISIQPGQAESGAIAYVLIDLDQMQMERVEEDLIVQRPVAQIP